MNKNKIMAVLVNVPEEEGQGTVCAVIECKRTLKIKDVDSMLAALKDAVFKWALANGRRDLVRQPVKERAPFDIGTFSHVLPQNESLRAFIRKSGLRKFDIDCHTCIQAYEESLIPLDYKPPEEEED